MDETPHLTVMTGAVTVASGDQAGTPPIELSGVDLDESEKVGPETETLLPWPAERK
jgi:hypothetical protein